MNRLFAGIFLSALLAGGALTGCATTNGDDRPFTHITTQRTGFLEQGPGQNTPPDSYLGGGTRVRVLGIYNNYAQVETVDGRRGWVLTSDLNAAE